MYCILFEIRSVALIKGFYVSFFSYRTTIYSYFSLNRDFRNTLRIFDIQHENRYSICLKMVSLQQLLLCEIWFFNDKRNTQNPLNGLDYMPAANVFFKAAKNMV